jgi:hypothetical protein
MIQDFCITHNINSGIFVEKLIRGKIPKTVLQLFP